jgi:tRNA 2-thiouridine synthesizing protein A
MDERTLDCAGLRCPMPIVRISQAIKAMPEGGRVRVTATDPAFHADVQAWVRRLGHALISFTDGPLKEAIIEKGPGTPHVESVDA